MALHLPLATTVLALIVFGLLHIFFELRYVVGRFGGLLRRPFFDLLLVGLMLIAVLRLAPLGESGPRLEILTGYALMAGALAYGLHHHRLTLLAGFGVIAGAATLSLSQPAYHFAVIAHLHNLIPLFFLWEWSRQVGSTAPRSAFRAVQLAWTLAIPTLILAGTLDGIVAPDLVSGSQIGGGLEALIAAYAPPAWREGALGVRFLTVFAFLQLMHYFVWCGFIPRVGRVESVRFERMLGDRPALRGGRLTALAFASATALAVVFWSDYQLGRTLYGSLASFHAYFEYPIILVFALAVGRKY